MLGLPPVGKGDTLPVEKESGRTRATVYNSEGEKKVRQTDTRNEAGVDQQPIQTKHDNDLFGGGRMSDPNDYFGSGRMDPSDFLGGGGQQKQSNFNGNLMSPGLGPNSLYNMGSSRKQSSSHAFDGNIMSPGLVPD